MPGPGFVREVAAASDCPNAVLHNSQAMFIHERLGGTGCVSILPVNQAFDMGAVAVGATVYYGAEESRRQIEEFSDDRWRGA